MKSDREARQRALDRTIPKLSATVRPEDTPYAPIVKALEDMATGRVPFVPEEDEPRGAGTGVTMVAGQDKTDADRMNQLETRYSRWLDRELAARRIVRWRFQAITLRLAKRTHARPDFWVQYPDGHVEIHQTKGGHKWEDARLKDKLCAVQWPEFTWVWVTETEGGWFWEIL